MNKKLYLYFYTTLTLFFSFTIFASADDEGGILGGDFAKNLGSGAVGFLGIGAIYIIAKRINIYSRKYLTDDYKELKDTIQKLFSNFRSPLLSIHNIAMILATILAVLHGIGVGYENNSVTIFGWLSAGAMIILSLSGILVWSKLRPIWDSREQRKLVKFVHRQWLFSIILVVGLILHLIIAGD